MTVNAFPLFSIINLKGIIQVLTSAGNFISIFFAYLERIGFLNICPHGRA